MPLPAMSDGMPHGYCFLWNPSLVWLHAISDGLTALAYFSIPVALLLFVRRRTDLPFPQLFALFGLFILACGTTHILGVVNIWVPTWWLTGGAKAVTAMASVPTAIILYRQLPAALALPSPAELRAANAALQAEIVQRQVAQTQLEEAQRELESRVQARTAELARVNAELELEHQRYQTLVEASAHVVWTTDVSGAMTTPQPAWDAFTGQHPDESRGLGWLGAAAEEDRVAIQRAWAAATSGEPGHELRVRLRRADATWRTVEMHVVAVRPDAGPATECVATLEDMTEQVETDRRLGDLERQLHQAQRLESIGRLAGGVAHDFNNLLTVIEGTSTLLLEELPPESSPHDDALEIRKAARRAGYLTRQLLAFSRQQVLRPQPTRLSEVVVSLESLIRRLIGESIRLTTTFDAPHGVILADRTQLEQVIMNLAVNARDAMPDGGTLRIAITEQVLVGELADTLALMPGRYVQLEVTDTGHGMDALTSTRIFEPFFTTKPMGKGTGLGLATVYGIVKQSGGSIRVRSAVGEGTTFTLFFPLLEDTAEPALGALADEPITKGDAVTVILAEDDDAVRQYTARVLTMAGYRVVTAENGAEALRVAAEQRSPVQLLLTDVVMPGMNGAQLAERFRALHPQARIVFMSGYTDDPATRDAIGAEGATFIAKPFTPSYLITKLRLLLR
jgi:PAS domain S-box-containing protein